MLATKPRTFDDFSNNLVTKTLINELNIAVPTLISMAMKEQPKINEIMETINQIDHDVLQQKVKNFMENDPEFDNYLNVVLSVYLSTLMYENNIFPDFIHSVLVKIGINDITIDDLKLNSKLLINMLINKQTNNIIGGGLEQIINILKKIWPLAFMILVIYADYCVIVNPNNKRIYEQAANTYDTYSLFTESNKDCGFVEIPVYIELFAKWNPEYKIDEYYTALMCVSQKKMLSHLKENYEEFYPDFGTMPDDVETKMGDEKEMSTQLVPYIDKIKEKSGEMVNSLIVYNKENNKFNIEETLAQLTEYSEMSDEEIINRLFPDDKIFEEDVKQSGLMETITDGFKLLQAVFMDIKRQTGISTAFTIKTSVARTIKKYCILKKRELQDNMRKMERTAEDYMSSIVESIEDVSDLLSMLPWLMTINVAALSIFSLFIKNLLESINGRNGRNGSRDMLELGYANELTTETNRRSNRLALKNGTDEISNSTVVARSTSTDDPYASANQTTLVRQRRGGYKRKTRKNKSIRTKKLKRGKKRHTIHRKVRPTKRR